MDFTKMFPGVWHAKLDFQYPGYNYGGLLARSGSTPFTMGFQKFEEREFPFTERPDAAFSGGKTSFRFPLGAKERLYGLGLGYQRLEQTMQVRHLRCDHYNGTDNGRTHVPTPFYISDAGYGIFIDSAAVISFYMGGHVRKDAKNPPPQKSRGRDKDWISDQRSEYVEVSLDGGKAELYVFAGSSMTDVVARFNLLCGGGCLPPKWGLGMWHRINISSSAGDVEKEVEEFQQHQVPLSVIGLEPGWQTNAYPCTHEWDPERFPDPGAFMKGLLQKNVRINIWENLYIAKTAGIYEELKSCCGSHTVWGGAVPDFLLEKTRQLISAQHKRDHLDKGVSGYKVDECDGIDKWLWPDHAEFPSGVSGLEMRQILAPLFARMVDELYRGANQRTYGLIRGANAGMSSLPYCIYNDCYDFHQYMTGLVSTGFTGALWCPEIRRVKNSEEWVRRFQIAALSPLLMINSWADRITPWHFPDVEDTIREIIALRESLLPYLYTAFAEYRFKGIPPFRALCMDFSGAAAKKSAGVLDDTANPYSLETMSELVDQYMAGHTLMAAPAFTGMTKRDVFLPAGEWYDYYTGEALGGGKTISVDCPLEKLPLFVRGGEGNGMVPIASGDKIIVRCYGPSGGGLLYDDDGLTYDFESGAYFYSELSFTREGAKVDGTVKIHSNGYDWKNRSLEFMPVGAG